MVEMVPVGRKTDLNHAPATFSFKGPLVAVDLDQTLIYSARACGIVSNPLVIAEDHDGIPSSFMTLKAAEGLEELAQKSELIVVTTRSTAQVKRVLLPQGVRYVLCSNGGVLLTHGQVDATHAAWAETVVKQASPLDLAWEEMRKVRKQSWVHLMRKVENLFCYLSATDIDAVPGVWLKDMKAWAYTHGFSFSVQGRKVYLVPAGLTKGSAVSAFRTRSERTVPLYAAGDSRLDAEMLNLADFAVRPPHGELSRDESLTPRAIEVSPRGVLAGEAIVGMFVDKVNNTPS